MNDRKQTSVAMAFLPWKAAAAIPTTPAIENSEPTTMLKYPVSAPMRIP